jgi:phosphoribosylformylglycinamidine synthase
MADRAGTGVQIFLDRVPQREEGMNPYEIMLSESQERMLLVVKEGREQEIIDIFERWELDVVRIGEVVEGTDVELFWYDDCISSMPVNVLTSSAPQYRWPEAIPNDYELRTALDFESLEEPSDLSATWMSMLSDINLCSRKPVFDQYDSTVRTNTVVHPGGDAAVIRIKSEDGPEKGVAMTLDCNSRYCAIDPRIGTALTVAESCRNITAVGAVPLAISDCLNFASPERPEGMWEIAESIRGLGESARAFKTPIVSGNVSLYNETKGRGILPTPTIAMVGLMPDSARAIQAHFLQEGDIVFVVGQTREKEIGASEYLALQYNMEKGMPPILDYDLEIRTADFIRELISEELLQSCHDLSSGGLGVALAECCCGVYSSIGATLTPEQKVSSPGMFLFSETGARYIISCSPEHAVAVEERIEQRKLTLTAKGTTGGSSIAIDGVASIDLKSTFDARREGLSGLMR